MARGLACFVAAALAAGPVAAALPAFDVSAHCDVVARQGGYYSASLYAHCIAVEEQAREEAAEGWEALPPPLQAECEALATIDGTGSYQMLTFCIGEISAGVE